MFDFMEDIKEIDRKGEAFSGFHKDPMRTEIKASPMKSEPKNTVWAAGLVICRRVPLQLIKSPFCIYERWNSPELGEIVSTS